MASEHNPVTLSEVQLVQNIENEVTLVWLSTLHIVWLCEHAGACCAALHYCVWPASLLLSMAPLNLTPYKNMEIVNLQNGWKGLRLENECMQEDQKHFHVRMNWSLAAGLVVSIQCDKSA